MNDPIESALDRSRQSGERVALARVVGGPRQGSQLLVWPAGEALGDLGSPRINQRVALYAEGLLARGGSERKLFDAPDGELEIETTVYEPERSDG